ncbi:MAG: hypothetical protein HY711_09710 [Candidatus Melainabacteria bacterium]|nr:hypothetical protein [Candidatus Melainabacteria bacterium]
MEGFNAASMAGPGQDKILAHNIREHVEVVLELLSGSSGVTEPAKARLLAHIAEEERSNTEWLNRLMQEMPGPPPRELRLMRDHSEMLLDILEGAIPQALGLRLLHHMAEEHTELLTLGREDTTAGRQAAEPIESPTFQLSLGSLRGM